MDLQYDKYFHNLDDDKPAEVKKSKNNTIDFKMSSPPNI